MTETTSSPTTVDLCDWLVRTAAPAFLRATGFQVEAEQLEAWPQLTQKDLDSKRGIRGLIPVLKDIADTVDTVRRDESNRVAAGRKAGRPWPGIPATHPERSPLEQARESFPGLVSNGDAARWAFPYSRAGWWAYYVMMGSITVAFVESDGEVTDKARAAHEAVMADLAARTGLIAA
jgi:hypothetical protein